MNSARFSNSQTRKRSSPSLSLKPSNIAKGMAQDMAQDKASTVRADYASPQSTHVIQHSVGAPDEALTTESKVAYLNKLRFTVVQLQGQVNDFLTQKMEDDKAIASKIGAAVDDKKEEENYGEELAEDDA